MRSLALRALTALFIVATWDAAAATRSWKGDTNLRNWSQGGAWIEGVAPVNGDRLVFGSTGNGASYNDLGDIALDSITVTSGWDYSIGGGGFTLTSSTPITISGIGGSLDINVRVRLTSTSPRIVLREDASDWARLVLGDMVLGGGLLSVAAPGSAVSWQGSITETAPSSIDIVARDVYLGPASTFSGTLTLTANSIGASATSFGTAGAKTVIQGASGPLGVPGEGFAEPIDLHGTGATAGMFATLHRGPLHIQGDQHLAGRFEGPISGPGRIVKDDLASLTLANPANSFTGSVEVSYADLTLAAAEVIPDTNDLVVATPLGKLVLGPFTETVRSLDCSGQNTSIRWVPGAQLLVLAASRLSECRLELALPDGYVAPAEMTLLRNDSGIPISGSFHDLAEGTPVFVNGSQRYMTYSGGASGKDVALISATSVGPVDQISGMPEKVTRGSRIASPGSYRVRDRNNAIFPGAKVRVLATAGCGTFEGVTTTYVDGYQVFERTADAQGIVDLPAYQVEGLNTQCLFSVGGVPAGSASGDAFIAYDPDTVRILIDPYKAVATNSTFELVAVTVADAANPLQLSDMNVSWEVVSTSGGASATIVLGDGSSGSYTRMRATANGNTGTYEMRVRTGNQVSTVTITQSASPRSRMASGSTGTALTVLDGGTGCGMAAGSIEGSPPQPPPGWNIVYGAFRFLANGCTTPSVHFRLSLPNPPDANAAILRYGPVPGESGMRWQVIGAVPYEQALDFELVDGVTDDDTSGVGSITTLVAYGVPQRDYQGMWWSGSQENGWGVSIVQRRDTMFSVIYAYDDAGKPTWYVMPGGTWNAAHTVYSGPAYVPRGSPFYAYDVNAFVPGAPVGNIAMTFDFAGPITVDYTLRGVIARKTLIPQTQGNGAQRVRGGMWWGGDSQNGWGVATLNQDRGLFSVWFTYDAAGVPTWFVMPSGAWEGVAYRGRLYRTLGSPWLGRTYDPAQLQVIDTGAFALRFGADVGLMEYSNEGHSGSLVLRRQPF